MKHSDYIEKVNDKFLNARNHGHNGGSWWYPRQNVIAYDVKIYCAPSADAIRDGMTERQKEYYNDEAIYDIFQRYQDREAEQLRDDIVSDCAKVKDAWFAGRSGGWLEVEYENEISSYLDYEDTKSAYLEAKELDNAENKVAGEIERRVEAYKKYITSKEFIKDFIDNELMDDEMIGDIYKSKAKILLDKLK